MADAENLMQQAKERLQRHWGYPSFRKGQDEAIQSIFDGNDTLVLFPTGGGKSLCYQIPASVFEGLTIVISPLVALMQDQVMQLNSKGIPATFINSNLSKYEVEQRLVNARNGMYKLLYCAPERLRSELWKAEAPRLPIEMVAIDEAHCISEWGHDFRPVYRQIRPLIQEVTDHPPRWLALTATATPEVREDILENLEFEEPVVISKGFERPNLKWWSVTTEAKDRKLFKILGQAEGTGLIYGGTRRNCERLAGVIRKYGKKARAYHAGIEAEKREKIQQAWIDGSLPLVVATSAFGMGIDKEDCRYVVHYTMPYSLESYYQEAGRAGRDGQKSYPILLYQEADYRIGKKRIQQSYPTKEELQGVYDALCDMLNLAVGSEMEAPRPASVQEVSKRARIASGKVTRALRLMDQFDVVQYISHYNPQIGLQFVINKDYLSRKIQSLENRKKAQFLDQLIRLYGWQAFHERQFVDIHYLTEKMDRSENSIIKGLEVLQKEQYVEYEYLGENPLILLTEPRVSNIPVRKDRLERHRNMLMQKLHYMRAYVKTAACRSRFIRKYFGENEVPLQCGFCDNCLRSKQRGSSLKQKDLSVIQKILKREPKSLKELKNETQWGERRLKNAISYLTDEGKIYNKIEDPYRYYLVT